MAGDLTVYRDPTDKSSWLNDICMFADVNGRAAEIRKRVSPYQPPTRRESFIRIERFLKTFEQLCFRATPAVLLLIRDAKPGRARSRPRDWGCLYLCDVIRT